MRYEASKEEAVLGNLQTFQQRFEDKTTDIDFNDLVYKAKRIPVKKYIEYKREIRLSKLKQVDIEANINDMKNLIVKADEELEENIGTEKKSMEEIAQAVKYSREQLEKAKKKKLETNSELNAVVRNHNETKTRIAHLDNEIRELRAKNEMMEKNRKFLLFISGLDEDPKWNPKDGKMMIDCEMVFVGEFKDVKLPDLDLDEDVLNGVFSRVMITETSLQGKASNAQRDFSKLSDLEKRNGLLRELKSPEDFMDKLRAIESSNLDIIQYSQTTVEEINKLDKRIKQMTIDHGREFRELELNKKSLEETKRNLEKTIVAKSETIERANQNKLQSEPHQKSTQAESKSPKTSKKQVAERPFSVMQLIEDIFRDNTIEELRKEYQGATILQQLLCIEKSLKVLVDNKASKKEHEAELKKHGKNMEPLDLNRKRKEALKLEQDELKKQERENQLKAKLGNKNKRRDMGRTFIQEAEEVAPEEEGDKERELHEKYFT